MTYTREMAQAEANLARAMQQWNIVRTENSQTGTGVFIDNDTRANGRIVPTRMEYVREGGELRVTRIQQGNTVFYGRDANGVCHESTQALDAFFLAQPQLEAVFNTVTPAMSAPFNQCRRMAR